MNRHLLACLLALCFSAAFLRADALHDANTSFAKGDHAGAATAYEGLLAEKGPDATLYYNLGNARQQLKQYGPAILAYERARLITPRDPDLLANLARARKDAAAFEEPGKHPRLQTVISYFSIQEWSIIVATGALATGIIVFACGAIPFKKGNRRVAFGAAAFACVVTLVGSTVLWLRHDESTRGIIISDSATLRLSPFGSAESVGTPAQGRTVRMGSSKAGFHHVTLPDSQLEGWLSEKDVAAVVPR